jgi:hypothetical protein
MIKLALIYFVIGLIYALISGYVKDENRFPVFLATLTCWPIFLFSLIGAGWNVLLNGVQDD